ncbi:hypothetical protein [Facklamia sp. 7083-14-GEN3]|uniref:hypothetical protein n=1 Tax=Facklamia sp. 7083-14-GEN3 TaxID=2973478 RepID=UPI00215CE7FB|nr:hypothetical protein [Facklamia sp. 7083-14-GEN3]MCR8969490.1 hypothetical protein [Facklamia sp. 7083-14-GEN3]
MFPEQKTDKRPFFSKRLLVFFLVMILLVFSSFLFFGYLNNLKDSFQTTFVQDSSEWQHYSIGQELLENKGKSFSELAKDGIELLVLSYDYSQTGRIGEKRITELTYYVWDYNQEKIVQVNIDPQLDLFISDSQAPKTIREYGLKQGELALVEQLTKSYNLPIDFLIILDLDSLEEVAKINANGVLFEDIIIENLPAQKRSQLMADNLMDYRHFLKLAKELNQTDYFVKSNISFDHFLKFILYYNLQKGQKPETLNLSGTQTRNEREILLESLNFSQ